MFDFHFLRPWVLILLPIAALCYWLIRKKLQPSSNKQTVIAAHLSAVLTPKQSLLTRIKPIDLIAALSLIVIIAAAGPAWLKLAPEDEKPAIAVVLKVTQAMQVNDLSPTRLQRAKQKINDLLAFRAPAKTAFFVYSDTSHRVLPLTEDHNVFAPFIDALSPEIMPGGGSVNADDASDAIKLAQAELNKHGGGTVIVLADDFSKVQIEKLKATAEPFVWWQFATDDGGVIIDADSNTIDQSTGAIAPNVATAGELAMAERVAVSISNQDLLSIDNLASQFQQQQLANDADVPYKDMAWYLIWPALLLNLLWYRRGWTSSKRSQVNTITLPALCLSLLMLSSPSEASIKDWFFTPDQQAMMAYNNHNYADAASLFSNPYWQARALYENGDYVEAARIFATLGTADGFYNRGNALLKGLYYEQAIDAYELALKMQPEHKHAQHNLVIAKKALQLVKEIGPGIDAEDSVSLDVDGNEMAQEQDGDSQDYNAGGDLDSDSKDAWMRSVESKMSDFLSIKFNTEAKKQEGNE